MLSSTVLPCLQGRNPLRVAMLNLRVSAVDLLREHRWGGR